MPVVGLRTGISVRARVLIVVIVFLVAVGSLLAWKRYEIAIWYAEKTGMARELAIRGIMERARPVIEINVKMNFFQSVFSALTGRRNEGERQADALTDVRVFAERSFKSHSLQFKVARNLAVMDGYQLHGLDFALIWRAGTSEEVLAEFDYDIMKREMGEIEINQGCGFLSALKLYIEQKAKAN
jgi:hypothetical protein